MNSFISNENKALLWELLVDSNSFNGLSKDVYEDVKNIFEKEIITLSKIHTDKSLTEINKILLFEVTRKLNPLRTSGDIITNTKTDISSQRKSQFSNSLKVKQDDFNNLINSTKPSQIDFSDVAKDEPIGSDIEDIISNTIASREQQINMAIASHNTDAATKWLGIKPNNKVKIGDKNENTIINKVTFEEPTLNLFEFLNTYENKPIDTSKIVKEIKHIYKEMSASLMKLNNIIKKLEDNDNF